MSRRSTGGHAGNKQRQDLAELDEGSTSLLAEFILFLKENKKYWLLPVILVLLLLGALTILAGSPAAPFIYTLF